MWPSSHSLRFILFAYVSFSSLNPCNGSDSEADKADGSKQLAKDHRVSRVEFEESAQKANEKGHCTAWEVIEKLPGTHISRQIILRHAVLDHHHARCPEKLTKQNARHDTEKAQLKITLNQSGGYHKRSSRQEAKQANPRIIFWRSLAQSVSENTSNNCWNNATSTYLCRIGHSKSLDVLGVGRNYESW